MSEESPFRHTHVFDEGNPRGEKGTRLVVFITLLMMLVEILAGWHYKSMALLADGWHMSSHAVAIGLSALAYAMARKFAKDPRFAFGTWKIEILGGFASALFLLGVSIYMVAESVSRLLHPQAIHYKEAMVVAALGLVVNVLCALILGHAHDHGHEHEHAHEHEHEHDHAHNHHAAGHHGRGVRTCAGHHVGSTRGTQRERSDRTVPLVQDAHDLNLRSAYVHVLADAATSVLAIAALAGGMAWGLSWLDPLMGIAGAVLIALWARGLLKDTSRVLLDCEMDHPVVDEVREALEKHPQWGSAIEITDLHVWRAGKRSFVCIVSLATREHITAADVREALKAHEELVHVTAEIERLS